MEHPVKPIPQLTLKETALRRIIVHLWNDSDILASIMQRQHLRDWIAIEDKIKDKILKIGLPQLLTQQMVDVVEPISSGIKRWKSFHEQTFKFSCIEIYGHGSPKLYFTTVGTIDNQRTAKELVKCVRLNIMQRYQIACLYWLEDCIPFLWEELTEEDKEYFSTKNSTFQGLQFSWPRIYKGRQSHLDSYLRNTDRNLTSFNQWAFEHSVKISNKATVEYFFHKLTHEERDASLMRCAYRAFLDMLDRHKTILSAESFLVERFYDVFCYLLSLMTPKQQMEIVKACPLGVLSCFLDWPRRDLFFENADFVWPFIPPRVYGDLLHKIAFAYDTTYFPKFFPRFFQQSPLAFQDYFLHEGGAWELLSKFVDLHDSEGIRVVFRNMNVADKVKLVFNRCILVLFYSSMENDNWSMVEVCLQEAMLSWEDKKRLKATFIAHLKTGFMPLELLDDFGSRIGTLQLNDDQKFKSFYDFLDQNDMNADKEENGPEH